MLSVRDAGGGLVSAVAVAAVVRAPGRACSEDRVRASHLAIARKFELMVNSGGFWSWQGGLDGLPCRAAEQVLPRGEHAEESRSGPGAKIGAGCCDVQLIGCGQFREVPPQR